MEGFLSRNVGAVEQVATDLRAIRERYNQQEDPSSEWLKEISVSRVCQETQPEAQLEHVKYNFQLFRCYSTITGRINEGSDKVILKYLSCSRLAIMNVAAYDTLFENDRRTQI